MLQRFSVPPQTPQPAQSAPPQAASLPPNAGRGSVIPMLEVSIQRLEEIVDQETAALRDRKAIDLKDYNDRKSQALLELTRSLRNMQGAVPNPTLAARVGSLRAKLAANQHMLKLHLEAVREISTSLSDAIRQSESDGTYTRAISAAYSRS
ncbi:flagellar protein FlgN [Hyphomicrobium zavarzinii]|jgi:hypothetical protein|uniref:flagellar protein FlgN n=1 Tax=Hyphomicrobium zavarzinii TaxID=48292 RepID=UPI00235395E3|nr:flagellar protein FlgN [Hyphomicrobium zavarzinii]